MNLKKPPTRGVEIDELDVMAGRRRAWRFANHPDIGLIAKRDAG